MTTPTFASDDAALPPEGAATALGAARRPVEPSATGWNRLGESRARRLERASRFARGKQVSADDVVGLLEAVIELV